jgi:ABC-type methionine transport system permease subunit
VVDRVGETDWELLGATEPMPSIDASVTLVVFHVSVADCPWSITDGLTVMLAVGNGAGAGAGAGGGGGGGAAAFLWHPARIRMAARQTATRCFFSLEWIIVNLLFRYATLRQ